MTAGCGLHHDGWTGTQLLIHCLPRRESMAGMRVLKELQISETAESRTEIGARPRLTACKVAPQPLVR